VAASYKPTRLRAVGNRLIKPLVELGVAGRRTHVLTTLGRKSGKRYSTPVQPILEHGQPQFLVAPYGERQWVRNARAAGVVELTRARKTKRFRIEEVGPEEAAPVLRQYLRKTPIVKPYFDARRDSPLEEFAAEAVRHPVFRLTPE
jgi:deazaflavin-dependent oxidoreductase (nitroreductase family)